MTPGSSKAASLQRIAAMLAVAVLALAASAAPAMCQLDRAAIASGEVWRLWTGHLVHGARDHMVYDIAAAMLLMLTLGPSRNPIRWAILSYAWAAPILSTLLLLCLPDLDVYYGLSSLLHTWIIVGAVQLARQESGPRTTACYVLAAGTILKGAWETWSGTAPFSDGLDMGGPVVFASHLIGAGAGGALALGRGFTAAEVATTP